MHFTKQGEKNDVSFEIIEYQELILHHKQNKYRVILKKVSFGAFRIILVSKEEKHFTTESKDKGLSLSKFSWYLGIVKIIKIRHSKGHISQTNHDLKNVFMQK